MCIPTYLDAKILIIYYTHHTANGRAIVFPEGNQEPILPEGMEFRSVHDEAFLFDKDKTCKTLLAWVEEALPDSGFDSSIIPAQGDENRRLYVLTDNGKIAGGILVEDNAYIKRSLFVPIIKLYVVNPGCCRKNYGYYLLYKAFSSLSHKPFIVADVDYGNNVSRMSFSLKRSSSRGA